MQGVAADPLAVFLVHHGRNGTAFDDGFAEQALGRRHGHQGSDLSAAARLAEDGDVGRIAAEGRDVVADPFECLDDIGHSDVAGCSVFITEVGEVEMAQDIEPVVEGHDDDIVAAGKGPAVIGRPLLAVSAVETAAVEPDHNRAFAAIFDSRCPDIEAQAVLVREAVVPSGGEGLLVIVPTAPGALRAGRTIGPAAADAIPADAFGRHETLCLAVRNALVDIDAVFQVASDVAAGRGDAGSGFRRIEFKCGADGFAVAGGSQQQDGRQAEESFQFHFSSVISLQRCEKFFELKYL